jgi:tetratricopeptide (TPR) repeat protein
MAKKEENKDLLENPEVIAHQLEGVEHWIEKHLTIVLSTVGALALVVAGYFGYQYWVSSQDAQAQKEMFQAVRYFEMDSLKLALNGDGNNLGFLQIIDDYRMTDAGKLANFYVGAIYMQQSKFQPAILYLEDYTSNDLLVQARAYSLIGDAHMELKDFDNAVKYYNKAANHEPNKFFTPSYLIKAALAYEKLNQNDKAKDVYQKIIDTYFDSQEYQNARKFKARLETTS